MQTYADYQGNQIQAMQLIDPCTVITSIGEYTGHAGQWLFYRQDGTCEIVDDSIFKLNFTIIGG